MDTLNECSILNCNRPLHCKNLCNAHYYRQRAGIPLDKPMRPFKKRKPESNPSSTAREASIRYYHKWRNAVIESLGGKCANCGYDENILGLDIDHINNDGGVFRKQNKGSINGSSFRRMYESGCIGLQLLCGTCHHIKTRSFQLKNYTS